MARRERGRLFDATSWSPSFNNGMTSASEQFIMSVRGPNITGRHSLITRGFILSGPGDLLDGMNKTIRWTSVQVTAGNIPAYSRSKMTINRRIYKWTHNIIAHGSFFIVLISVFIIQWNDQISAGNYTANGHLATNRTGRGQYFNLIYSQKLEFTLQINGWQWWIKCHVR